MPGENAVTLNASIARLFVVADSNFYRGVTQTDILNLSKLEAEQDVVPLAGFWPAIELLSHLADPHSQAFGPAISATRKLVSHCGYVAGGDQRVRMMEDGELQMCRGLFGVELSTRVLEVGILSTLLAKIHSFPSAFSADEMQSIVDLKVRVDAREASFAAAMSSSKQILEEIVAGGGAKNIAGARREFLRSLDEPGRRRWTASAIASQVATRAKVDPAIAVTPAVVETVLLGFPVSVEFFVGLLRSAGESDINWAKTRNRNSMWDWLLSFHAAPHVEVNGRPVLLISSDSRLRKAASDAKRDSWVVSVQEYEELVTRRLFDRQIDQMTAQRNLKS